MTPRQWVALMSPCARAWDTIAPQFGAYVSFKGSDWSTILTVNK